MNKDVVIPEWIGKSNVPEDRGTTLELLNIWVDMLGKMPPEIGSDLDDEGFVAEVVHVVNKLNKATGDLEFYDIGIWVGFPETPIGNLNAALASKLWNMKKTLEIRDV